MLTCRLEGSWLEIFDRHYLIPLVRSWNRLQQKLYCALHLCLHGWRGLAEQSQAVADDLGAVFDVGVQEVLEVEVSLRLDRLD